MPRFESGTRQNQKEGCTMRLILGVVLPWVEFQDTPDQWNPPEITHRQREPWYTSGFE